MKLARTLGLLALALSLSLSVGCGTLSRISQPNLTAIECYPVALEACDVLPRQDTLEGQEVREDDIEVRQMYLDCQEKHEFLRWCFNTHNQKAKEKAR
jgi:hypothetical protein